MTDQTEPPLAEPIPAPEVFVDGYASVSVSNGVARFTFFSIRHDPNANGHYRLVVLRMSAPMIVVSGMHQAMGDLLENMARQAEEARVQ